MSRRIVLACAAMLSLPSVAAAAGRDPGHVALARNLAFDRCDELGAGDIDIDGPEMKQLGFTRAPVNGTHPRVGAIRVVGQGMTDTDGITVATSDTAYFCQVTVYGTGAAAALKHLRAGLPLLKRKLLPDPAESSTRGGRTVEAWKESYKGTTGRVRLEYALAGKSPMARFELSITED